MLLMLSCAKVGPPPGGPEDKIGPVVQQSYPNNNATQVPRKMVARLVFSKPVNYQSVEAALFLSPDPRQRLRYRWRSGHILELIYMDSLEANRTYVISVGSQAKDLRGNPAGSTNTVAFSTGDQIDRGRIAGWVSDIATPQAVSLWAYQMRGDSVSDPIHEEADYRLQAGSDGLFLFSYLRFGRYRVYAVTDKNFDGFWNPTSELLGIPPWDVTVADSASLPWLSFKLAAQDSAPAQIRGVREIFDTQVDVRMSRVVSSLTASFDATGQESIAQAASAIDSNGSDTWHVFTPKPLAAGDWIVKASGKDLFGKPWQSQDSLQVRAREDTASPHILYSDPLAGSRVRIPPEVIRITFNQPIRLDSLFAESAFLFADSDSAAISIPNRTALTVDVKPAKPMIDGKNYKLRMNGTLIQNLAGRTLSDTTVALPFSIYARDSLGGIRGELAADVNGQYLYRLLSLRDHREICSTSAKGPGPFRIEFLPAGKYLLEIIRDNNKDGQFSYGGMWPHEFAEPYIQSPDTVTIRARWDYETHVNWTENPQER
jgi:uncharacterized protein (DUF2141 family)